MTSDVAEMPSPLTSVKQPRDCRDGRAFSELGDGATTILYSPGIYEYGTLI